MSSWMLRRGALAYSPYQRFRFISSSHRAIRPGGSGAWNERMRDEGAVLGTSTPLVNFLFVVRSLVGLLSALLHAKHGIHDLAPLVRPAVIVGLDQWHVWVLLSAPIKSMRRLIS